MPIYALRRATGQESAPHGMSPAPATGPADAPSAAVGTGLDAQGMSALEESLRATLDARPDAPVRFLAHRLLG